MKIGCSWSGGKDSCYALMVSIQYGNQPAVIVNMMNENGKISRSHGLPLSILQQQADAMKLPLIATPTTWTDYKQNFVRNLDLIKSSYDVEGMVFGDIDLQQHRDWEEMVCRESGLEAILPLWKQDRKSLVNQMLETGISAMIVSCNMRMGEIFLGRIISPALIVELENLGVDACGENGEFHTVVINCPLFNIGISLPSYTTVCHNDYWFLQWEEQ